MKVPLLDLKAQYSAIEGEILSAITEVMASQRFTSGPLIEELEQRIAQFSQCAAGVGVSSGTDALLCSLMALDVGPDDEVITTPYTFFAAAGCVWRTGARPVFVDIEPDTYNIDPSKIEAAVTEKTKAIIPVHLYGQMADMDPIMTVARKYGLHVIEDAAQAIGSTYKGRKAGSIGTTGCFSFYPTKNLNGLGDGGMIVTQDCALAEKLAALRQHGETERYHYKWIGGNFRLGALQAAALIVKLRHLDDWSAKRRANAARYDELLAGFDGVARPIVRPENVPVYNLYVIAVPRRDELLTFLQSRGVGAGIYYPLCLHEQECFADLGYKRGDFPVSERAAGRTLALPIYPEMSDEQIQYVVASIKEFLD